MRISTKGRYGLRIMLDVANPQQRGPLPLRKIARCQAISQKYLWQVIHPLTMAGITLQYVIEKQAQLAQSNGAYEI